MRHERSHERWGSYQLAELLEAHGVSTESWGSGEAKEFAQLLAELNAGESFFELSETQELRRVVEGVWLDVVHETAEGQVLTLVEDRQVFADGRMRRRGNHTSLGEKLKHGESPERAVNRGLREELGIRSLNGLYYIGTGQEIADSRDYPGLALRLIHHDYAATISSDEFQLEGYIERQADKTTHFVWQKFA